MVWSRQGGWQGARNQLEQASQCMLWGSAVDGTATLVVVVGGATEALPSSMSDRDTGRKAQRALHSLVAARVLDGTGLCEMRTVLPQRLV